MEHSYFKDRISAFIDGELPPYENQVVGEHLADCEECQLIKSELEKFDSLIEKHSNLDGDEYWEKSAQKIENRLGLYDTKIEEITPAKRSKYKGLGWKLATVAASVAVLTFIGLHEEDIFKNIDTSPKMQAPSINLPPSRSFEQDDLVLNEEVKEESVNRGADLDKRISGYIDQEMKDDKIDTITEKPSFMTEEFLKPEPKIVLHEESIKSTISDSVTIVEELLNQIEGGIDEPKGEVFYRSDSDKTNELTESRKKEKNTAVVDVEMEPKITDIDNTINVKGRQGKLTPSSISNEATISTNVFKIDSVVKKVPVSKLDFQQSAVDGDTQVLELNSISPNMAENENGSLDSTQLLVEYINRKDSLLVIWNEMKEDDRKLKIKSSLQKMNQIGFVEKQLLSSYYDLAVIAKERDIEEYNSAVEFLKEYAKDSRSRYPVDARNYLKRLDIISF